jgi:hypothetical protein
VRASAQQALQPTTRPEIEHAESDRQQEEPTQGRQRDPPLAGRGADVAGGVLGWVGGNCLLGGLLSSVRGVIEGERRTQHLAAQHYRREEK